MDTRFPLSLPNIEDLLFERGVDICHETVRFWWNRFGPLFAADIRRQRVSRMKGFRHWHWHLDEVFLKINGERQYLSRAVDHDGEVLESFVMKKRDKLAALAFMKKALKRHGKAEKRPSLLTLRNALAWKSGVQVDGSMAQQASRVFSLAIPTTRASDAALSAHKVASEIRFPPRLLPQSLQLETPPRGSSDIQHQALGCPGRVAVPHGLKCSMGKGTLAKWRRVCIRLTARASGVVFLCSEAARFMTADALVIDGGFTSV